MPGWCSSISSVFSMRCKVSSSLSSTTSERGQWGGCGDLVAVQAAAKAVLAANMYLVAPQTHQGSVKSQERLENLVQVLLRKHSE